MASDKRHDRDSRDETQDEIVQSPEVIDDSEAVRPNPPRTTAGGWTSPKFGSSGSGGAELEPGPERD